MRLTRSLAGLVVASSLALTTAPTAVADDASFVRSAKQLGFVQASDNLVLMARSACYYLSLKRTPDEVTARIMRYANVNIGQAHDFLGLSIAEYCP